LSQISITVETVDNIVSDAWKAVIEKINSGHLLSSEKTLCYLFAMTLFEKVGSMLVVDFENQCYDALEGDSKYLDLLFYTDTTFKVAVEFKLPRKSNSGASNQPQTRQAIYRDIARLHYLKNNSIKAGACYFLMAVNEHAYLNKGKYRNHVDLQVHHEHKVSADNILAASGVSLAGAEFEFNWQKIKKLPDGKHVCDGAYAWLNPIKV
jgi:hypothetical protein